MLSSLTITEARQKLSKKEISATELTAACIERMEKVDGTLNAVVHRNFDSALEQAKKIDAAGDFSSPLSGIPYLAKDVFCEVGVPTTACSNMLRNKDYVPPYDSTVTKKLKAAGAISMGKVNTDEFTMGASTETSCFGPSKNPWNTEHSSGGSSGGSAVAVAADECLFATATDTGGSIRQPAGFTGTVGLRSTYGRVSRFGCMPMASSLDTTGAICKSVEDLALVLEAIAGKDTMDATTSDTPVPHYGELLKGDVAGMTIGIPTEYFQEGLSPEVEKAVIQASEVLQSRGMKLKEISLPHTKYAVATYYVLCPCEVSSNMSRFDGIRYGHTVEKPEDLMDYYVRARSEGFGSEVKRRIMIGTYALSAGYYDAYYRQAQKVRTLLKQDFEKAFEDVDIILSPVSPHPAFKIGAHQNDPVAMYLEDIYLTAQVMAGIPALSLPCGFSSESLPIGLQLMGKQWNEETVLKVGHAYQLETDHHTKKPLL